MLRTDAATGQAVEQTCAFAVADGTRTCAPERLAEFPEGLGAPLGSSPFGTCASDLGTSVVIGGTTCTVARVKQPPAFDFPPPPFAAGIGPLEQEGTGPLRIDRFEFARVRGVE